MSVPRTGSNDEAPLEAREPPDGGGEPDGRGAASNPTAIRNWTILTALLAVCSFASAAGIISLHGGTLPAAGATLLGVAFAAIALTPALGASSILVMLDDAWQENRLYAWFAAGLFAFGIAMGAAVYLVAGVDLVELITELLLGEFDDDQISPEGQIDIDLTATFFIVNNTPPFLAAIFGALTLGLVTAIIMVFNGFLIGNLGIVLGSEIGFGLIIALLAPHGIFELAALFVAAGIGFRFVHRAIQRFLGSRDALLTKSYLVRTGLLIVFAWLVLVLAAFVEAYLTIPIAEFFFGDRLE